MSRSKIAITVSGAVLRELDALVREGRFPNRSRAFEAAAEECVQRARRTRLAAACTALDRGEERALAEEGLANDLADWPEY